jgi:hypothetical protein
VAFLNDREKFMVECIKEEEQIETAQLGGIKQKVFEFLIKEKQFKPEEIETDPEFRITLSDSEITVHIDFVVNLSSASFILILCRPTAIESWERYIISSAKVIKDYQIPYVVVTDGEDARIIDVLTGRLTGKSLSELFNREEALNKIKDFKKIPCPANRLEKEKRIVYAFEGIKCPTAKDSKE